MKGKRSVLIYVCYQYLLSRFLGVSILQLLITYRIHDYDNWRCHSNSVNTGSRLPNISDVKTRKRRNMIGIDIIRSNRWNSNRWWPDENIALPYQAYPSFPVEMKTSGHRLLTTPLFTYVMQSLYTKSVTRSRKSKKDRQKKTMIYKTLYLKLKIEQH